MEKKNLGSALQKMRSLGDHSPANGTEVIQLSGTTNSVGKDLSRPFYLLHGENGSVVVQLFATHQHNVFLHTSLLAPRFPDSYTPTPS